MPRPKSKVNLGRALQKPTIKRKDISRAENPKPPSPSRSMGFRARARAVSLSLAVGLAGIFGGRAVLKNRAQVQKERAAIERVITQERLVRNPSQWAEIAMIYGWNPATKNGIARIELIENVSRDVGVSPKRVMLTLEQNKIDSQQIQFLRNAKRHARTPKRKEQIERVISVLTSVMSNLPAKTKEEVVEQSRKLEEELRGNRGSLNKLRKVSD